MCSRLLAAVAVLLSLGIAARADTVDFTYTATAQGYPGTIGGSGDFSYVGTPATLTLADLTSFDFEDTFAVTAPSYQSSTFTYDLADLSSFSATLSGDTLLSLSLGTVSVKGTSANFVQENFTVTSLEMGEAQTNNLGLVLTSTGTVSQTTATPEPSSLVLLGTGVLGVLAAARRNGRGASPATA